MNDVDKMQFRDKRILITGANGFIGRHLAGILSVQGAQVSFLDRIASGGPAHPEYIGDLRDAAFVDRTISHCDPEIIFHLAAYKERVPELEAFSQAIAVNVLGSLNLFTAAKKLSSLRSIIVIGTAEEYGRNPSPFSEKDREAPVNAYSYSKLCVTHLGEMLYKHYGLPCVMIRPTLAYGPGQDVDMFLPALIQSLINDHPFLMTPGRQTRDYLYITDLIDALMSSALERNALGQIINVGSGQSIAIADLALKVQEYIGKTNLVKIGAKQYRAGEAMEYSVDGSKAKQILHWQPRVLLEQGLKNTITFYQRGK